MSKILLNEHRDIQLLKFLWRWKLATTATLTTKFFSNCSNKTAYNRLLALKHFGVIRLHTDSQQSKFVWSLTKAGYQIIRPDLPYLENESYRSEHIAHDLVVSAFHLGDWLVSAPAKVEFCSEQELRALHPDIHPDWVPKTTLRRPDGYWRIPIKDKMATFALEVELTLKRNVDYEILGDFYAYNTNIVRTIWVTHTLSAAKKIEKNIRATIGSKFFTHNFVLLPDIRKFMWQTLICIGPERDRTVTSLMQIPSGNLIGKVPSIFLLDTRKCIFKSDNYKLFEKGDFAE